MNKSIHKLPEFLRGYFWEVEFDKIDLQKYRVYVLMRILNYGDKKAIAWMWKNFTEEEIKNILYNYRDLSLKSANFWAVIVGVKKEDVKCLKIRLSKELMIAWPY